MALDAKQIVQRNKALLACYGLAIVPIVLWVLLVVNGVQGAPRGDSYFKVSRELRSKKSALEEMAQRINETQNAEKDKPAQNPVYTPQHKKAFEARNEALVAQHKAMIDLISERDKALEQWFQEFQGRSEAPAPGDLEAKIKSEIDKIKTSDRFKDFVVDPSTKSAYLWSEAVAAGNQRSIQKKWWIQERLLNALRDGGGERLLQMVEFPPVQTAPFVAPPAGQAGPPKPFTSGIPVKVVVAVSMRDVPRVCREVLARDIVFKVNKVHVELLPFSITKKAEDGFEPPLFVNPNPTPVYEQGIYTAFFKLADKVPADEEAIFPEPRIKLSLELEAVDFDVDAINAAAGPPPAPPEKAEKDEPPPPPKKPKEKK